MAEIKVVDNLEELVNEVEDMVADTNENAAACDTNTEPTTVEDTNLDKADEAPAKEDYMKGFGRALVCGALGALGAAVANKIVIPACEKAIHKACDGIKGLWNKHKEKKAKTEETPVEETEKEPKKKTDKK